MLFVDEWEAFIICMDKAITKGKVLSMTMIVRVLKRLKKYGHISICSDSLIVLSEIKDRLNPDDGNLK